MKSDWKEFKAVDQRIMIFLKLTRTGAKRAQNCLKIHVGHVNRVG